MRNLWCTLSNRSAQLELQFSLGVQFELLIKKYICTITIKKSYLINHNQRSSEFLLMNILRNTKRIFTPEQKVFIVMKEICSKHSLAEFCRKYLCKKYNIKHIHSKFMNPQTQGKIERYHISIRNVIKLNHYSALLN